MDVKKVKPNNNRYQQGYVNPKACKKLFPSLHNDLIIYRSSYEKRFIHWLESSDKVKYWGSECFHIPYISRIDGLTHKYYPDYFVEMVDGSKLVIEIKPYEQTHKPVNESNGWARREWIKNVSKWTAAQEFCKKNGLQFKILTEKTINRL